MEKKIHQGKNITRFRQMLGIKQDVLATIMGEDWTQIKVSRLETKEDIEPDILDEVARALKIPADAIKNFDEEAAITIISNNFNDSSILNGINYNPTFNPIDKWIEALEEIKNLHKALLKEKEEKIALLEKMLQEKK